MFLSVQMFEFLYGAFVKFMHLHVHARYTLDVCRVHTLNTFTGCKLYVQVTVR